MNKTMTHEEYIINLQYLWMVDILIDRGYEEHYAMHIFDAALGGSRWAIDAIERNVIASQK